MPGVPENLTLGLATVGVPYTLSCFVLFNVAKVLEHSTADIA